MPGLLHGLPHGLTCHMPAFSNGALCTSQVPHSDPRLLQRVADPVTSQPDLECEQHDLHKPALLPFDFDFA